MGRNRNLIRIEAIYRKALLNTVASRNGSILITEFPKCGASWLAQLISDVTKVPFPRQKAPMMSQSIFHGHYLSSPIPMKTIVFWRDPRDVTVSWYHHCLFYSDKNNHSLVDEVRRVSGIEDADDVAKNLPKFINYMFNAQLSPRFSLRQFYDSWVDGNQICNSSYEALINDPCNELERVLSVLGYSDYSTNSIRDAVQRHSFKAQTNRDSGIESKKSYLRKGVVGDWKNYFVDESLELLESHLGDYNRVA